MTVGHVPDLGLVRGSSLVGYRALVAELGTDPDPLLRDAGVRPEDAGSYDALLPASGLVQAVETAAAVTGVADLGLRLALRQGIEVLGPLGVAARTAATFGDALRTSASLVATYCPSIRLSLDVLPDGTHAFLGLHILPTGLGPYTQTVELALGNILHVMRDLHGPEYSPVAVHLPHAPVSDPDHYRDHVGCAVRFAAGAPGFTLRSGDLERPLGADPDAHAVIVRHLRHGADGEHTGLTAPARVVVQQLLAEGPVTAERVARQFAVHPKTLQRRLSAEGVSVGSLIEETRRELALGYLRDTDLGLTEVASRLGYSEQSVLTRSCKRWFGDGPTRLRERLRAEERVPAGGPAGS